jgi:hypothetical protein
VPPENPWRWPPCGPPWPFMRLPTWKPGLPPSTTRSSTVWCTRPSRSSCSATRSLRSLDGAPMERLRDPAAKPGNASRRLLRHLRRQVHRPALGRALLRSGLPPGCLPRAARAVEGVDGASRAVAGAEAAAQARRRGPARAEEAREARRCGQQSGPAICSPTAGLAHPCGGRERTALPFERSRRDSSARARRSPSAAAVRCRQRRETSKGHGRSWRAGSLRELVRVHYSTG